MRKVYMDSVATTHLLDDVFDAMVPYFKEEFGNPLSLHDYGERPRNALEEARKMVAELINSKPGEIIFTASGSESNNLAIKGVAHAKKKEGKHIITSAIEHQSVLNPLKTLQKAGFEVTFLGVDKYGSVSPEDVENSVRDDTILITIMHANNEIGTIQDTAEIGKIAQERGIPFHTDAVASAGVIPTDVEKLKVDLLSLATSQFYGPKGAGALYIREGVRVLPLIEGGIQENGLRSGTHNAPAIVGMGKAAQLARRDMRDRNEKLTKLRDKLIEGLLELKNVYLNGHREKRLPNNVNVSVEYVEGESMLLHLNDKGIYVSSGSACTSHALKASHVLTAIGVDAALAQGSLLFSLGINNTAEDVDYILNELPPIIKRLRKMSPLGKNVDIQ